MWHCALNCHRLKWLLMISPIEEEHSHHEFLPLERMHHSNGNQPIVMRIWEAAEENAIHHAEHCRGRANPHRERGNHCNRENWVTPEPSQCITKVLQQTFDSHPAPGVASVFFDESGISECAPRCEASFFKRQSVFAVFFFFEFHVRAKLALQVRIAFSDLPPSHRSYPWPGVRIYFDWTALVIPFAAPALVPLQQHV